MSGEQIIYLCCIIIGICRQEPCLNGDHENTRKRIQEGRQSYPAALHMKTGNTRYQCGKINIFIVIVDFYLCAFQPRLTCENGGHHCFVQKNQ